MFQDNHAFLDDQIGFDGDERLAKVVSSPGKIPSPLDKWSLANTPAKPTTIGASEDETVMASYAPCSGLNTFDPANASIGAPESPNSNKPKKSRNARRREKRKEKRRLERASTGSGIVSGKFASAIVVRQQIC